VDNQEGGQYATQRKSTVSPGFYVLELASHDATE
jgi:hypothetical protein